MRLPYPEYAPRFIDGKPWGLGAIRVHEAEPGWQCPHCSRKTRKHDCVHHYIDGDSACTSCATAWAEQFERGVGIKSGITAHVLSQPQREVVGQLAIGFESA